MAFVRWGLAGMLLLATAACASRTSPERVERVSPFEQSPLYGMVYDHDNLPCAGASVFLDGRGRAVTDRDGRFLVPAVTPGRHRVQLQKQGYEELVLQIDFEDPMQVLYARLTSLEQLLAETEHAIARRDWGAADETLARASALGPSEPSVAFLYAVLDYDRGAFAESERRLRRLLVAQGEDSPPVLYLFLAELYERHLHRPGAAIDALEHYLLLSGDPAARDRLDRLRSRKSGGSPSPPDGPESAPPPSAPPTDNDSRPSERPPASSRAR